MLWGERKTLSFFEAARLGQVPGPELRAVHLFRQSIPSSVFNQYCHTGEVSVVGERTGTHYVIRKDQTVLAVDCLNEQQLRYCIHDYNVPPTDNVLSLYLILTACEPHFLKTANKSRSVQFGIRIDPLQMKDVAGKIYPPESLHVGVKDVFGSKEKKQLWTIPNPAHRILCRDFDYSKLRTQSKNRPYSISFRNAVERRLSLEMTGILPPFYSDGKKKLIRGLSQYLCSYVEVPTCDIAILNCGLREPVARTKWWRNRHKGNKVILGHFNSVREIDNLCLFLLASAVAETSVLTRTGTIRSEDFAPPTGCTKCIMSRRSFQFLEGALWLNEFNVLIDDRADPVIFFVPDAPELGTILHCVRNGKDCFGIIILEPQNVKCYTTYQEKHKWFRNRHLVSIRGESAVEVIYGLFPENDTNAMAYDMDSYALATDVDHRQFHCVKVSSLQEV